MKFIALISGGKDSTFAIHECQRQGHELVALANLYPLEEDNDGADNTQSQQRETGDLDSWCFQTVGHGLVAAHARCAPLGVPLYRRATRGAARRRGLSYPASRATPGDEVEDLAALLSYVASRHRGGGASPLGVCSGAVASDYQRLRVEAVACGRLGLVSLAPLWRRAQAPLLRAMDAAGVRAVIAKVAAAGLDPRRDLGSDVAAEGTRRRLAALRRQYGLNVCGEGGEYETLTLDAPVGVFARGRIVLGSEKDEAGATDEGGGGGGNDDDDEKKAEERRRGWRLVVTSEDAVAPGGVLVPVSFRVVPRGDGEDGGEQPAGEVVEVPRDYEAPAPAGSADAYFVEEEEEEGPEGEKMRARITSRTSARHLVVGCRVLISGGRASAPPEATARAVKLALRMVELVAAMAMSDGRNRSRGPFHHPFASPASCVWPKALFVHLLLPDMAHFAAANAAYCSVVPLLRPPARACVEAALPEGCLLHVDALILRSEEEKEEAEGAGRGAAENAADEGDDQDYDDDDDGAGGEKGQARLGRRVLHVQSVSPWAPACIGPYSQAAADGRGALLHLAGQIPLDPASMEMVGPAAAAAADEESAGGGGDNKRSGSSGASPSPATVLKHTDRVLRSCQAVAVAAGGRMDAGGCAGAAVYLSRPPVDGDDDEEGAAAAAAAAAATTDAVAVAAAAVSSFLRTGRTEGVEAEEEEEDFDEEEDAMGPDDYLRPLRLPPRVRVQTAEASWPVGDGAAAAASSSSSSSSAVAPCVYAVVPALPRGSLVEVQPTLLDLRAFAPGGGAGDPPSSSSSSSEEEEEDEEEAEEQEQEAAIAAVAAQEQSAPVSAEYAAIAAAAGARAYLHAYSWAARAPAQQGRRRRQQQQQERLAARLLVSLPPGAGEGDSGGLCRAAAAAVSSALGGARAAGLLGGAGTSLNVVSVRAWCTPEAYAELAGPDEGNRLPTLDAALDASGALGGALGGGGGAAPSKAAAQLIPALEVRLSDGEGEVSGPCAAVLELVILN